MPITFHFRVEANLVISVHTGTTPDDEIISSYRAMYENDLFDKSMNRLMDLRRVDMPLIGNEALRRFAELVREQFTETGANPKAAVIAAKDLFFDLTRMYEAITDIVPLDVAVFHSAEEALAWLGLPGAFLDDLDKDASKMPVSGKNVKL